MIQIEAVIDIERSVDEIFAFVSDFRNLPQWQSVEPVEKVTSGQLRPGTQFRRMARGQPALYEITGYEHNRRLAWRYQSQSLALDAVFVFEAVPFATQLRVSESVQLGGWLRWAEPVLGARLRGRAQANLQRLKRVLESQPTGER